MQQGHHMAQEKTLDPIISLRRKRSIANLIRTRETTIPAFSALFRVFWVLSVRNILTQKSIYSAHNGLPGSIHEDISWGAGHHSWSSDLRNQFRGSRVLGCKQEEQPWNPGGPQQALLAAVMSLMNVLTQSCATPRQLAWRTTIWKPVCAKIGCLF